HQTDDPLIKRKRNGSTTRFFQPPRRHQVITASVMIGQVNRANSCFDANGGLFETLLGAEDAIISDALNHASIIDGVRLCKAKRY
ncbi:aminotransferase class I/II-fold pyridoxal phosphate-dependent enzyme, partial [Salmonella enterica subsp. enterica serovar Kentucky]|nr:aminotransferase class I/II-fold pyridoxal phosphate-dependent enzyme [Salmonella enterica subsp. enterica serovar Kentucky]